MTVRIELSQGFYALIDPEDEELVVSNGPWHVTPGYSNGVRYARHSINSRRKIQMHSLITGLPYVDHINRDGLDNRRSNLRAATHQQNMANKRARSKSGFKGVNSRPDGKFVAQIGINYRRVHLGVFDTAKEAALAYDAAALTEWGEFARLNFPPEGEQAA